MQFPTCTSFLFWLPPLPSISLPSFPESKTNEINYYYIMSFQLGILYSLPPIISFILFYFSMNIIRNTEWGQQPLCRELFGPKDTVYTWGFLKGDKHTLPRHTEAAAQIKILLPTLVPYSIKISVTWTRKLLFLPAFLGDSDIHSSLVITALKIRIPPVSFQKAYAWKTS